MLQNMSIKQNDKKNSFPDIGWDIMLIRIIQLLNQMEIVEDKCTLYYVSNYVSTLK